MLILSFGLEAALIARLGTIGKERRDWNNVGAVLAGMKIQPCVVQDDVNALIRNRRGKA